MAPSKMSCKNNSAFSYTGKEMSPMGLGYCADGESVGKELMGRDGKAWVVGVKNSNKMWMRAPDSLKREEPVLVAEAEAETELPPLEEIPNDEDEDVEQEDPFGWKPEPEVVAEEVAETEPEVVAEPEVVKPEPKKKAAGRPKKVVEAGDEEEVKPEPKKAGRPKKVVSSGDEAVVEVKPEPKKAGRPKKVVVEGEEKAEPKKAGRPKKVVAVDEAEGEVKPKRKYTRKVKPDADEAPVKERKPRAKTEYNEFIGKAMKEMREKNKELKTTDYMKLAIEEWKTYKASKLVATA